MSGKLQTVSKNGIGARCRFNLNFNFLYVHQGSKYSSSHTLFSRLLCDFAERYSGEWQNNAILLWKQSMLQAEFKLIFSYEQQGLVCNPTKYMSLTLNLHLENLWLTILDIVFYRKYDGSKSNNSVYSYVCPIPHMSLQSHKPADRKKRR